MTVRGLIVTFILLLLVAMTRHAGAAGMDIGMTAWYCWWEPSWNNEGESYKVNPAFFYGPGLSFRLPANVTISSSFLYARVKTETPFDPVASSKKSSVIQRYDSDTTISYSFTRFFKLLAGVKYSHYRFSNGTILYMPSIISIYERDIYKYNEYAPALGAGFTIHLVENLFLIITASVLYERSFVSEKSYVYESSFPQYLSFPIRHWILNKIGANAHLAFAYLIQPIDIMICAGFRYQFFKILKSETRNETYHEYYDHFYGINASVIYRIEFKKNKEQAGESL